ncbi:MAG: hypothetical protein E7Z82_08540 [Methanobrevibacter sp.]|jgi:hypothetical protein|nr:hypothetical protein [Methanobrevibacter sp.]
MAYGKLKRFAEENETCNGFLEEGQVFEAWTIYIRECEKSADEICEDIDQEVTKKSCPMSEDEKESLQVESMEYLRSRRWETNIYFN